MRNQRGQFVLEGVLLMVVMMAVLGAVVSFFNRNGILENLVKTPWQALAGMLEDGEWTTPAKAQGAHPNQHGRHVTIIGVKP